MMFMPQDRPNGLDGYFNPTVVGDIDLEEQVVEEFINIINAVFVTEEGLKFCLQVWRVMYSVHNNFLFSYVLPERATPLVLDITTFSKGPKLTFCFNKIW
jgi:hypothetical protein